MHTSYHAPSSARRDVNIYKVNADLSSNELGGAVKAVLGEAALNTTNVSVHPMLIAGWCGLVSTALNLLPVGAIDGGRILQVRGIPL